MVLTRKDEFLEAVKLTVVGAKDLNSVYYLFLDENDDFYSTSWYEKSYLLKAYPGGRKEFSLAGVKLARDLGCNV